MLRLLQRFLVVALKVDSLKVGAFEGLLLLGRETKQSERDGERGVMRKIMWEDL